MSTIKGRCNRNRVTLRFSILTAMLAFGGCANTPETPILASNQLAEEIIVKDATRREFVKGAILFLRDGNIRSTAEGNMQPTGDGETWLRVQLSLTKADTLPRLVNISSIKTTTVISPNGTQYPAFALVELDPTINHDARRQTLTVTKLPAGLTLLFIVPSAITSFDIRGPFPTQPRINLPPSVAKEIVAPVKFGGSVTGTERTDNVRGALSEFRAKEPAIASGLVIAAELTFDPSATTAVDAPKIPSQPRGQPTAAPSSPNSDSPQQRIVRLPSSAVKLRILTPNSADGSAAVAGTDIPLFGSNIRASDPHRPAKEDMATWMIFPPPFNMEMVISEPGFDGRPGIEPIRFLFLVPSDAFTASLLINGAPCGDPIAVSARKANY